jgi:hypothetical protein
MPQGHHLVYSTVNFKASYTAVRTGAVILTQTLTKNATFTTKSSCHAGEHLMENITAIMHTHPLITALDNQLP